MTELAACRACLAMDVMLYPTVNLYTQEVYQHLTNLSFDNSDGKPRCLCYECHSVMRRCVEFRDKCLRADGVMNQLLCTQMLTPESISMTDRHVYNLTSNLICTPMEIINIDPTYFPTVKTEDDLIKDVKRDILDDILIEDNGWTEMSLKNKVETQMKPELAPRKETVQRKEKEKEVMSLKMEFQNEDVDFETKEVSVEFEGVSRSDSEDDLPLTSLSRSLEKTVDTGKRKAEKRSGKRGSQVPYAKEVTLTMEEQLAELKQRATSSNYLHSQYKCDMCYKGFVDETAFRNHMDKHDESRGPLRCAVCALRYGTPRQLRAHEASAHARRYHCLRCTHRSHTKHQARDHDRWHRGVTYRCRLCGKRSAKPTSHLTHMRSKHAGRHVCLRCGDCFVGGRGLRAHCAKAHRAAAVEEDTPPSVRTCEACNLVFLNSEAYKRHTVISIIHKNDTENSNACGKCAQRFASADELSAHMRVHRASRADKPPGLRLPCDRCDSTFGSKSKLQGHTRRVHLGLKYNKDVVCELCGKKCTSNATLRYHQRTHTGARPYPCTHAGCARRFADSNQLRIHARTHSGERPYRCGLCERAFRQKPALNRHMRVHTGAKPYSCQYCPKNFSQSNSLKLHIRTVHLKLPSNAKRNKAQNAAADKEVGLT